MSKEVDIFRDTNLRYLGYANEVGESFRPIVPVKLVRASYLVAFAYALADTTDKGVRALFKEHSAYKAVTAAGDALIWQTLASIIIPGITINRICALSHRVLCSKAPKLPPRVRNITTVAIGLASIPIIVGPIDTAVSALMSITYRRWVINDHDSEGEL